MTSENDNELSTIDGSVSMQALTCPLCEFSTVKNQTLQDHVYNLHPDILQTPKKETKVFKSSVSVSLNNGASSSSDVPGGCNSTSKATDPVVSSYTTCPFCDEFFASNTIEDHVETHMLALEESIHTRGHVNGDVLAHKVDDCAIAAQLEMEELRKIEDEKLSQKKVEELYFKMLQDQYHMNPKDKHSFASRTVKNLDTAVGRKQISVVDMYKKKFDMLEQLDQGLDDNSTGTQDVVKKLKPHLVTSPNTKFILVTEVCHYGSGFEGPGWSCGYRNAQMMFSSLLKLPRFSEIVKKVTTGVPSIPCVQELIEKAWSFGFDPRGRAQLDGKLVGTRKWIGATEIFTLFASLGFHCRIVDCTKYSDPHKKCHPALQKWVYQYFCTANPNSSQSQSSPFPILYLQHEGHSRSIAGIKYDTRTKLPTHYLILDPAKTRGKVASSLPSNAPSSSGKKGTSPFTFFMKPCSSFNHEQYQVVAIVGIADTSRFNRQKDIDTLGEKIS